MVSNALDDQVKAGALRWLHQIDVDPHSLSRGVADRTYWAWKLRDVGSPGTELEFAL